MAEETKKPEDKDKKDDKPKEAAKEKLTMDQLRDLFVNKTKHENRKLSSDEEGILKRMIALIETEEGNTRSGRNDLEDVQRWIPSGHPMDRKVSEALMGASNSKKSFW